MLASDGARSAAERAAAGVWGAALRKVLGIWIFMGQLRASEIVVRSKDSLFSKIIKYMFKYLHRGSLIKDILIKKKTLKQWL